MDSLLSLEVVINFLKFDNLRNNDDSNASPAVSCLFPCVAFRLLDYPAIAINLIDEYEATELKSRLQITEPIHQIEKFPCFTDLLDTNGRYIFSKGKSCLFRADLDTLRSHLRHTPLYLMILDTFLEPHKLIGTVSVPLYKLIDEIHGETEVLGKNSVTPSIKMNHGVMDVKNLMGETLGHLSFVIRLTSFGTTLLPHIDRTTEAVRKKEQQKLPLKNKSNSEQKQPDQIGKNVQIYHPHPKTTESTTNTVKTNENAIVQTVQLDYKDARIQISELKTEKRDKFTQSPEPRRKIDHKPVANDFTVKQDDFAFDHYCPPPLHYNTNKGEDFRSQVNQIIEEKKYVKERIEYLKNAVETEEKIEESGSSREEESIVDDIIEYKTSRPKAQIGNQKFNLDQMPLLKCLFEEISSLKNIIEGSSEQKFISEKPNHYKSAQKKNVRNEFSRKPPNQKPTVTRKTINSRERFLETVERLSQPKLQPKINKAPSQSQTEYDEVPVKGPDNLEVKKKAKKPLRYGLTNAHRLRVLASRANKIQQIEEEHGKMLDQVKKNIDNINSSMARSVDGSRILPNDSKNDFNNSNTSLPKTGKSNGNYSLLNRVEMDSTYDTMNHLNTNLDQLNINGQTKMVQFGSTYVYDAINKEYSDDSNINKDDSEISNPYKNIFTEKKYENDFNSSLESSLTSSKQSATSTSNFLTSNLKAKRRESAATRSSVESKSYSNEFEDDSELGVDDPDLHSRLLSKINQSDLISSSKYSSRSFNSKSFLDESLSKNDD
ncbi:microtubule-associated 10-like [Brachionus plicatilis]|uniref:Microtubule-associated 10-like n=1 Tax=Brachionus plicatilis TaxID=10195 RepID=A0A3M7PTE8_BRAPC|nr:microtubule-associated 10-like [Brachionus plicatilis]